MSSVTTFSDLPKEIIQYIPFGDVSAIRLGMTCKKLYSMFKPIMKHYSENQTFLLSRAATSGCIQTIDYIIRVYPTANYGLAMENAILSRNSYVFYYLYDLYPDECIPAFCISNACEVEAFDIAHFCLDKADKKDGSTPLSSAAYRCAAKGVLSGVEWCLNQDDTPIHYPIVLSECCSAGHHHIVDFLGDHYGFNEFNPPKSEYAKFIYAEYLDKKHKRRKV